MTLSDEIEFRRRTIRSDGYAMSIGELVNLYRDKELDVHPEFQRIFRWTPTQKSRLIESLLLGIPLPSVFVAQGETGIWDVVDGVQRLSTILELMGILIDEDGELVPPLVLQGTKYLPSLANTVWDDSFVSEGQAALDEPTQLLIKRSKIDVKILLPESDEDSRYELFQRLNTLGSQLSDQELRNSLLISVNRDFYRWVDELGKYPPFLTTTNLSERLLDEKYQMDLVIRFLVFRTMSIDDIRAIGDLGDFLNDASVRLATSIDYDRAVEGKAFRSTFDYLNAVFGEDAFRRFDVNRDKFMGSFGLSAYETLALGVGFHSAAYSAESSDAKARTAVRKVWAPGVSWSGVRASTRIPQTVAQGRELFAP